MSKKNSKNKSAENSSDKQNNGCPTGHNKDQNSNSCPAGDNSKNSKNSK